MSNSTHISYSESESIESIDVRRYLGLLWRWAWLIALATLLATGSAYFAAKQIKPIYQAKSTVLVNEAPSDKNIDYSSLQLSSQLTQTYSQMMIKSTVLGEVAKRLGLAKLNPGTVSAQPIQNTQLITVSAESANPGQAAQIANTLVAVFSDQIQSLQAERFSASKVSLQAEMADIEKQIQTANEKLAATTDQAEKDQLEANLTSYQQTYSSLLQSYEQVRLAEDQTISSVVLVEPAEVPQRPVRPNTILYVALAGTVGLLLAAGLVLGIDMLDDTIRTPEEVAAKLGLPVLGVITHFEAKEGIPITQIQPGSQVSEAYRALRTNVQYAGASMDKPLRTILVTSPMSREGKTTTLINLAVVMAQTGRKVFIVDADMRHPAVHRFLGLANRTGLSQIFVQVKKSLDGSIQPSKVNNLFAITSGSLPPNPSELLGSQKMGAILEELKKQSEIVLVDTPPALAVTDAAVLVPFIEGVLLVVKLGSTHLISTRQLIEQFRRMRANLLGVVVNDVNLRRSRSNYYYYKGYNYSYSDSNVDKPFNESHGEKNSASRSEDE